MNTEDKKNEEQNTLQAEEENGSNEQGQNPEQMEGSEGDTTNDVDSAAQHQSEITALNDKYLRLYSEFENFRRRTAKERIELIGTATSEVIVAMLPVLDDFERAIAANETNEDLEAVKEGFTLIHQKMNRILEQRGLKPMKALHESFDPEFHEAVTNMDAPSKKLIGKNVDILEPGYLLNDKVIRYAKVVVGK